MSGGHWNYDYWSTVGELLDHKENVHEMAEYLRDNGKTDAGNELEFFYLDLRTFFHLIERRQERLKDLMKALDYWICNDYSEDQLDKEWQKILEGMK